VVGLVHDDPVPVWISVSRLGWSKVSQVALPAEGSVEVRLPLLS
jgi:hypothetical protein